MSLARCQTIASKSTSSARLLQHTAAPFAAKHSSSVSEDVIKAEVFALRAAFSDGRAVKRPGTLFRVCLKPSGLHIYLMTCENSAV